MFLHYFKCIYFRKVALHFKNIKLVLHPIYDLCPRESLIKIKLEQDSLPNDWLWIILESASSRLWYV